VTTDTQPITRLVSGEAVRHVLFEKGGTRTLCSPYHLPRRVEFDEWHTVQFIRQFASQLRAGGDYRSTFGTFPVEPVAAGLEALADAVEASPIADTDWVNLADEDRALLSMWRDWLHAGSPLLSEPARLLDDLIESRVVGQARALLRLLADVDLLLPGADAALRPVLTRYADLALLRLDLTDEQRERPTRIGQHGPEALRPPTRRAER
jgi:hypothetical protein